MPAQFSHALGFVCSFVHNSGAKVTHIDGALNISAVAFSPLGTYLLTWHRRKGGDKERKWAAAG